MNQKDIPAFPTVESNGEGHVYCSGAGMTLRDYFAAAALPEAIRFLREEFAKDNESFDWSCADDAEPTISEEMAVQKAYSMADAMLRAREAS